MPTGPELCARIASADLRAASDDQLLDMLSAAARQLNYQQALQWQIMAELADRDPSVNLPDGSRWTPDQVFDSTADEIRAELRLTRRAAERELANAAAVVAQPRIAAALAAGTIDRARAIVLSDSCLDLTDGQTSKLLDEVLPDAGSVTATWLAEKVQKIAIALDPAWAERRYKQAVRERRVVGYLNRDGSATVSGQNLPADEASAACARVDALASAAKRAGAAAPIDHLRAELFLGLLDGRFHGLSEPAVVDALLVRFPKPTPTATDSTIAAPPKPAAKPRRVASIAPDVSADATAVAAGVHLRVQLGTLLGMDDRPGEIAGWGYVPASSARSIAERQRASEWRFAVVDHEGQLLYDGITRRRPRGGSPERQVRGGIVELHVPLALVSDPETAAGRPEWAPILADLAAQYAEQRPIEQDPAARFAGRPLRRRAQTTFVRCLFPSCRRPAAECDLDHRREHARGGRTDEWNTGPGCRHDHMLKTTGGWRLVRRDERTFVWISPLGRKHRVRTKPLAPPLPDPIPRALPPEANMPDTDPDPPSPIFAWRPC